MIASTIGCSAHGWPSPRTNFQHVLRAVCFNFHAVCPQPELLKPCDPWAQEQSKRIWSRYAAGDLQAQWVQGRHIHFDGLRQGLWRAVSGNDRHDPAEGMWFGRGLSGSGSQKDHGADRRRLPSPPKGVQDARAHHPPKCCLNHQRCLPCDSHCNEGTCLSLTF